MRKTIGENNKVLYGSIDEPLDWNYKDFKLLNFFNKEIKGLRKKFTYHQFNYIGILNPEFVIGIAIVDLGHTYSLFSFYYDLKMGMEAKFFKMGIKCDRKLSFDKNPDKYIIEFKSRKWEILIMKSLEKGELELHCNFDSKLIINATFDYSWENQPLRVLNPSQPTQFTFTEKCSPLLPKEIDICLKGKPLVFSKSQTSAVFDWSGGYLRRETNWLWACMAGETTEQKKIGANLAALVNESFYPEDAFWIDGERKRLSCIIFDFDILNPYNPWHIKDENGGNVNLIFTPKGEFSKKMAAMPVTKIFFRQFIGTFSGYFIDKQGKKHIVDHLPGFTEYHRSIW